MTVTIAEGRQGARLRAAVERLYGAQLAALEGGLGGMDGAGVVAAGDAYAAGRALLLSLGEMGSLLAGLSRPGAADAGDTEDAAVRRRVVTLAVAGANTLAELVSLAFEVEGGLQEAGAASDEEGKGDGEAGRERAAAPAPAAAAGGGCGDGGKGGAGSAPLGARTSLRAVTDMHMQLVEQLKRLMRHVERRESWRSARPGELWRGLVQQVAGLLPLVAGLEAGGLCEGDAKELARLAADAANYIAFIRFYPRLPTA